MRNEIRQHCVLLLMIPAGYLRAQRPIMAYIRDICSQLRQYYPDLSSGDSLKRNIRRSSIAPPAPSALASLSRTPVGGGQVGTLTRNGGAVGR
ncbi:hypothetical protein BCR44DRAFT_1435276 [Catenaria anguillulae PL171]|uniref:Uncharacterized protein n=1 Tax=Catenaria anguillulae PL171 TaxID=765915 RepID=A0A1Y2HJU7_9FUNG|nr:hypothetical protein BCR44DRAFT_1435276 [Catenaria anguillulae PL171]